MARATSRRSAAERAAAWRPREPSFVGRRRELAVVRGALGEALDGRASVVLVDGDAGIGKTWLLQEVAAAAEDRGSRCAATIPSFGAT